MEIVLGNKHFQICRDAISFEEVQSFISQDLGILSDQFYLVSNGRRVTDGIISGKTHIVARTLGGKGGFGSMLRAIGAQIEKTTNREACRDLSGRRLRDINEEQRLKNWVAQQAEREKEAKEKKKKKLEKLLEQPKHEFKDEEYDKERSELPEKVEDAVLKGLEASCSTKRILNDSKSKIPKKKPKLWLDSEFDEDSISSSDSDSEGDKEPILPTSESPSVLPSCSSTEATVTKSISAEEEAGSEKTNDIEQVMSSTNETEGKRQSDANSGSENKEQSS